MLTCVHWIRPMWKAVSSSKNLDFRVNLIKNYRISQRLIPASSIIGSHVPRGPSDKTFTSYHFNISLCGQFSSHWALIDPSLSIFLWKSQLCCTCSRKLDSSIERRKKGGNKKPCARRDSNPKPLFDDANAVPMCLTSMFQMATWVIIKIQMLVNFNQAR